jgi:hypothetical protein
MQEWIEKLADKSTEGMLTPEERDEYEALVRVGKLGLFLGAKTFGRRGSRAKVCLILDRQKYRYQKFCSDIAGQDIEAHDGKPQIAMFQ